VRVPLISGDIVLLASDGVFDNVYDSQVQASFDSGIGLF